MDKLIKQKGCMQQRFGWHFLISMSVMLVTAMSCSMLQYFSAYDYFWFIVFIMVGVSSFVFSLLFSLFQHKLQQSLLQTLIFLVLLSLYFLSLFYSFIHMEIDWQAISEGKVKLTLFQQFIKSDLSFWFAYLVPFVLSFITYIFRSKIAR